MKSITTCDKCNTDQFAVIDSEKKNGMIVRRRKCLNCGNRIYTYEILKEDFEEMTALPQSLTIFKDAARQILEL